MAEDKEFVDLLRFVIKEELQPVHQRLDKLEKGQKQLKKDVKSIKTELHSVWQDVSRFLNGNLYLHHVLDLWFESCCVDNS